MRLAGFSYESIVDGPGIRVVIFVQGCLSACAQCHNPESWPLDGGQEYSVREILRMIKKPRPGRKRIRGITFSGGEPFLQAGELAQIAIEAKRIGWDVCTFTGYTYEELAERDDSDIQALLSQTDYLIDGPYIHELREIGLKFRGSTNQRLIDVQETKKRGKVALYYGA
ncbi:MAG: anaerobic ribonucleoside-triphosphate reductase activating protein [Defluviitaleaceae bacterium]|nr:anaerobic ribonucleoside-triphosphate reductase activating protein [Defluviitaleaceae bacterium]MCL2274854.1 anaerobic ribonucleoside-triphosphate reductase activating protein [Defluviitaleaceae bacterium]